jgi:hypothetical protein
MSFIHKIIDRATRHSNSTEEKPQRRSFFGFGGSTSASIIDQQTEAPAAVERASSTHSSLIAGKE